MKIVNHLGRFAAEAARAIRNFQFERTDDGQLYLPRSRTFIGGVFRHAHAPAGGEFGPMAIDPNRIVRQGLDYILNAALGGQAQSSQFFLAPFSGNVSPAADWTGATFAGAATEFTAYTSATRLPWTTTPSTEQAIGNTEALAAATLELNVGGPYNIYGVGLLEASAKGATTGRLIAATRFATPRTNMAGGDRLALEYVLTAKDEADA